MNLFGLFGSKLDYEKLMAQGAVVVDVRSQGEFSSGHVEGSKNISLEKIQGQANTIKNWNKPVILCCASGNRSGMAQNLLERAGIECYNGGSWGSVARALANLEAQKA